MADLLGEGETRIYWVKDVADATAPTQEELGEGVDLGGVSMRDSLAFYDEGMDVSEFVRGQPPVLPREIVIHIPVDVSGFQDEMNKLARAWKLSPVAKRLSRMYRRRLDPASHPPPLKVNGADYARRRRARRRRR